MPILTGVHLYDHAQPGMDKAVVQGLVRRKLNHHQLPEDRAVAIREIGRFANDGRQCEACDEQIGPNRKAMLVMVSMEWMSVFFHVDCYEVWDAERRAQSARNGDDRVSD
jgi:hypothetical protein